MTRPREQVGDEQVLTHQRVRECPACGLFQHVPAMRPGHVAVCRRCDTPIHRMRADTLRRTLALVLAGLAFYTVVVTTPLIGLNYGGLERQSTIFTPVARFDAYGVWELSGVVLGTVVVLPLIRLLMLLAVLVGLRMRHPPGGLFLLFRWYERIGPWAMIEVFLLGVLVAYTRMQTLATVVLGPALYALGALMLIMVAVDAVLDPRTVWRALERRGLTAADEEAPPGSRTPGSLPLSGMIPAARRWIARGFPLPRILSRRAADAARGGQPGPSAARAGGSGAGGGSGPGPGERIVAPLVACDACGLVCHAHHAAEACCPRCGAVLHARKPNSLGRTTALLAASAVLYLPANIYPVLTYTRLGSGAPSTILGGVQELLVAGQWPLALLVFGASVVVPLLKLLVLTVLLISVHRRWTGRLRDRTRLYRLIDVIGRWSMIDIFMLSVLVALVHLGFLAEVVPNVGSVSFASVVVLTMLAAAAFDPRVMWDAAGANGPASAGATKVRPGAGATGSRAQASLIGSPARSRP